MSDRILFTHPSVSDERKDRAIEEQSRKKEKGITQRENELPEEVRLFFPLMQEVLREEQKKFTDRIKEIDPKRVHYLGMESYRDIVDDRELVSVGVYIAHRDAVYMLAQRESLEKSKLSPEKKRTVRLRTLQHEGVHSISYEADYLGRDKEEAMLCRQGYMVFNPKYEWERFRGLNEAVVERLNLLLFSKSISKLQERFPDSSEKDWKFGQPVYTYYRTVLGEILENIAQRNRTSVAEVWGEYERGLFTGRMRHLSDVDRVYGSGSLRLLSAMGTYSGETVAQKHKDMDDDVWRVCVDDCFLRYFQTPGQNWKERRRLAKDILSEREFARFCLSNGEPVL